MICLEKLLGCLKNESNIDRMTLERSLNWNTNLHIPRSVNIVSNLKKYRIKKEYYSILAFVINMLFLIFWPVILIFLFIPITRIEFNKKSISGTIILGQLNLVKNYIGDNDIYFLHPRSLLSYLNSNERIKLLFFCLFSFYKIILRDYKLASQCYVLPELVGVHIVLDKTRFNELIFTNHYDRWATLFDQFDTANLKQIQHGQLLMSKKIPVSLKNIRSLVVNDKKSLLMFEKYILERKPKEVSVKQKTINIEGIKSKVNFKTSLLLVGTPLNYELENKFVDNVLKTSNDILVLIKPHPRFPITNYKSLIKRLNSKNVEIINYYPNVDKVVGLESSLCEEYRSLGYEVFDLNEGAIKFIIDKLN